MPRVVWRPESDSEVSKSRQTSHRSWNNDRSSTREDQEAGIYSKKKKNECVCVWFLLPLILGRSIFEYAKEISVRFEKSHCLNISACDMFVANMDFTCLLLAEAIHHGGRSHARHRQCPPSDAEGNWRGAKDLALRYSIYSCVEKCNSKLADSELRLKTPVA